MAGILSNLRTTVHISIALAILFFVGYAFAYDAIGFGGAFWMAVARWTHVVAGIMWIGLLWYFNFVQIPTMPEIPDEQKPAIGKHIAPKALFWFRWGAAFTVRAVIEHDRLVAGVGQPRMMPPFRPVHEGGREQAMKKDHWPTLSCPVDGKSSAVET